jgi:hypothetical protein
MFSLDSLPMVPIESFENWLDQEIPLLSYDPDPFSRQWSDWKEEFRARYEARPLLWLDRNQSGTSDLWRDVRIVASVDVGNITAERQIGMQTPPHMTRDLLNVPIYHPSLFWLARKNDPGVPDWVRELQAKVPPNQVGSPPFVEDDGIFIQGDETKVKFDLPAIAGQTHILRQRIQTMGMTYTVVCSIKVSGKWIHVGGDIEQIYSPIDQQFTDFYFSVPGDYITGNQVSLKLSAEYDCRAINVYRLDWAVREDAPLNQ